MASIAIQKYLWASHLPIWMPGLLPISQGPTVRTEGNRDRDIHLGRHVRGLYACVPFFFAHVLIIPVHGWIDWWFHFVSTIFGMSPQ